jgi:signal transduction histidine kinase
VKRARFVYRRVVPLSDDLPSAYRESLAAIERRIWLLVGTLMLVALAGYLLAVSLSHDVRVVAWYIVAAAVIAPLATVGTLRHAMNEVTGDVRQREELHAVRAREARLEGGLLVARTAAHRVNNALTSVAGFAELLAADPLVSHDRRLREYASLVQAGSVRASEEVRRLQHIVRLEEDASMPPSLPVLDLERSTSMTAPGQAAPDLGAPEPAPELA